MRRTIKAMNVEIMPSALRGTVNAPPSKSYAHRLLICAVLSDRPCRIGGISRSEDVSATLDCIVSLGGSYRIDGSTIEVYPRSGEKAGEIFSCRESASTLRFFVPLALTMGQRSEFRGSQRLIQRGIDEYAAAFTGKGIEIKKTPAAVRLRGRLRAGEYVLRGDVSSQFVSGLLFALPLVGGESRITVLPPVESRAYIDLTLEVLHSFGVSVSEREKNVFDIPGGQKYTGADCAAEGDWSNAAVLYALAEMGAEIGITGLKADSAQGDRRCIEFLHSLKNSCAEIDVSGTPDLAPVLMAFAAMNRGALLTGTKRLRLKESDRAAVMAEELAKFGARTEVNDDSVFIAAARLHAPSEKLSAHNDHRAAMALALPCLKYGGVICGAEAVNKSWPEFFDVLQSLGGSIRTDMPKNQHT